MTAITLKVDGLKELQRALDSLPKEIQGRPLKSAVSAGAKVILDEAISKAPVGETGNLRKSLYRYRSRSQSTKGKETYLVGVRKGKGIYGNTRLNRRMGRVGKKYTTQGEAYYWRFIEFGTSKMPAHPFLRPAFESQKERAVQIIKERLGKAIEAQTRKLVRK